VYDESLLAVALLVETRDAHSRFKHYIASLGQITLPEIGNIVTFTDDQLSVLNVSRPDYIERFESALHCIEVAKPSIEALRHNPPSKGEQLWAYGIVKSRAVKLKGRLALAPIVDLVNHGLDPSAELGVRESGGVMLRSLRQLSAGDQVTVSYGYRMSNIELLAMHGFVMPGNQVGPLLPVDFAVAIDLDGDEGQSSSGEIGACKEALSTPHLESDTKLLLDIKSAQCMEDRLFKYYEQHPTEIDVLSPLHIEARGMELIGLVCQQVYERYRNVAITINRLQQHGQRIHDWLMLQVAHEAVEDMRLLTTCADAARANQGVPKERDDL